MAEEDSNKSEIIIYATEDGKVSVDVLFSDETAWLTQQQMTDLFDTTKQNISLHIKNIFAEGELDKDSAVKEYLTTANDGKKYKTQCLNKKTMTRASWIKRLDDYLKLSEKEVLKNAGKISTKVSTEIANKEFEKYKKEKMKNLESDFDKETKKYLDGKGKIN